MADDLERFVARAQAAQRAVDQAIADAQPLLTGLVYAWEVFPSGAEEHQVHTVTSEAAAIGIAQCLLDKAELGELVCIRRVIDAR